VAISTEQFDKFVDRCVQICFEIMGRDSPFFVHAWYEKQILSVEILRWLKEFNIPTQKEFEDEYYAELIDNEDIRRELRNYSYKMQTDEWRKIPVDSETLGQVVEECANAFDVCCPPYKAGQEQRRFLESAIFDTALLLGRTFGEGRSAGWPRYFGPGSERWLKEHPEDMGRVQETGH